MPREPSCVQCHRGGHDKQVKTRVHWAASEALGHASLMRVTCPFPTTPARVRLQRGQLCHRPCGQQLGMAEATPTDGAADPACPSPWAGDWEGVRGRGSLGGCLCSHFQSKGDTELICPVCWCGGPGWTQASRRNMHSSGQGPPSQRLVTRVASWGRGQVSRGQVSRGVR